MDEMNKSVASKLMLISLSFLSMDILLGATYHFYVLRSTV